METLTIQEVADRFGVTEKTLVRRVEKGKVSAPTKFVRGKTNNPRWDASALDSPPPSAPAGVRMSRERHLTQLLDEARLWSWQHDGKLIVQTATGRVQNGRAFPLGLRVSALRTQHRAGRVPAEFVTAFEAIPGWTWNPWDTEWNARFDDVATRYPDRFTDADRSWLSVQRQRFERLQPSWQERFLDYPEMLHPVRVSPVQEFVEAAQQWLAESPDHASLFSLPFSAKVMRGENDPYPVGRRATYYRRRYAGLEGYNPMSAEDVELIESLPGWTWEMSPSHVAAQSHRRGKKAPARTK